MNGYTLAVFAHVLGALGLAVSLALEWVRETSVARRIGGISLVTLLVAGLYLSATAWSNGPPWISIALVWFVAIGALTGLAVRAPRLAAASLRLRIALVVGVVFLMTTKPELPVSLAAMAVATAAGIGWAFSARAPHRVHEASTPAVQR